MPEPFKFAVSPDKENALRQRFADLGIDEKDIIERFVRSGGHGGQNVNKVSTCVYLKHVPTGTEVKCQRERSQALNRFIARRILADKIENALLGKESSQQQERERIRRQKRRRSRKAKEKVLRIKHHTAEKKRDRTYKPDDDG
jgi:peptide chain release factor